MALRDYQKLCPKSGHALSDIERKALGAGGRAAGRAHRIRCDGCGQEVELCPDPGTGRSLLYAMHLKVGANGTNACGTGVA